MGVYFADPGMDPMHWMDPMDRIHGSDAFIAPRVYVKMDVCTLAQISRIEYHAGLVSASLQHGAAPLCNSNL